LLNKEASLIGMSENDIIKCNNDKKLTSDILLMRENAINEIGIKSTPSFIIEGKSGKELIVGARKYEDIKEYLEKRIKENR
jgi:predicted DsbA family dithiol-disulfide isomerase